jgi:predicted small lipoprotein YifL
MRISKMLLVVLFMSMVAVAGCGQKGELYLPEPKAMVELG